MNVFDTVRVDQLDGGENILRTLRIGREIVHIPVIDISIREIEHDHYLITGQGWEDGHEVVWMALADEDVDLWV